MARKINELTPKEVLALAIHLEQSNANRLRQFARSLDGHDETSARQFQELAEEEDHHEEWLTEKFKRRFTGPIPSIEELEVPELMDAVEWDASENKILEDLKGKNVFQLALDLENRATKFYQEAETVEADKFLALLFRQLADMEQEHVRWLELKIQEHN